MALPAGDAVQVTNDPANEWSAEESPDRRWIAFHSMQYGTRDILVMPREGGAPERLTSDPGEERFPQWSPDGGRLCYWLIGSGERDGMYVMARDSTGQWGSPRRASTTVNAGVWSPDGRWLVTSTGSSLRLVPADSGVERELYRGPPGMIEASAPKWVSGGTTVLFRARDRDGSDAFRLVPVTGGQSRPLVRFDDPNRPSSRGEWATDGRRLYFTIDDRQSDIFVAELRGMQ
jgi:TolB protein